jgi:DNA-binding response OmpR family regulator
MAYRLLALSSDKNWISGIANSTYGEYSLKNVSTAAEGASAIISGSYDLSLIDIDTTGPEWLKILRQTEGGKNAPVIVAGRTKNDDEVAEAFAWGADDYILKDCEPAELFARIRCVLRRRFERHDLWEPEITVGPIKLDPARHECWVGRSCVELKAREFELLDTLMRKAGRVLSRPYLLETIWGMSRQANTRAVDVAVSRLRRHLGIRAGRWIETVERYGYRCRDPHQMSR